MEVLIMSMDAIKAQEQISMIESMSVFNTKEDRSAQILKRINERAYPFKPEDSQVLTMDQLMERLNNV